MLLCGNLDELKFEVESNWETEDIERIMKELSENGYIQICEDADEWSADV